ncbi:unnamed protein product [Pocillopora meandrina]|uniref:Uncharacterized protein n=1 Tax=Pocillopora meandrina TaxID=46732 RepID=A0AAU9X4A8_9CNID|nr:unnamed protein product [Pocillopora meandrina]
MFTFDDLGQSSTFHELKAIYYVLLSFAGQLTHQRVKVFTDNQRASRIVSSCLSVWGDFSLFGFIIKHLFKLNGFEMTPCYCFRRSSFRDQSLRRLVPGLLRLQLGSKAPSTVSMYNKPVNLAKPLYIALFINELTNICVEKFMGVSPIELTLYGGSYYGRDGILPHWSSTREIICRSSEKEGGSSSAAKRAFVRR